MIVLLSKLAFAQFEPAAGTPGSSAIHKDSSIFINWAKKCVSERGYMDISNTSLGLTSAGFDANVTGVADGFTCVSLGDGGSAICEFNYSIKDEAGYDFAVFENSFVDYFLELAFVEASSDGIHYFRFPSQSLTDTSSQVQTFDSLRCTQLHNLAGKYIANYGTPFDVADLPDTVILDKQNIRYIRVVDVVGCMLNEYCSRDAMGRKINDPWPTPFVTGGFDLDAIGVIHQNIESAILETSSSPFLFYPTITTDYLSSRGDDIIHSYKIFTIAGVLIQEGQVNGSIDVRHLSSGVYLIQSRNSIQKFMKP